MQKRQRQSRRSRQKKMQRRSRQRKMQKRSRQKIEQVHELIYGLGDPIVKSCYEHVDNYNGRSKISPNRSISVRVEIYQGEDTLMMSRYQDNLINLGSHPTIIGFSYIAADSKDTFVFFLENYRESLKDLVDNLKLDIFREAGGWKKFGVPTLRPTTMMKSLIRSIYNGLVYLHESGAKFELDVNSVVFLEHDQQKKYPKFRYLTSISNDCIFEDSCIKLKKLIMAMHTPLAQKENLLELDQSTLIFLEKLNGMNCVEDIHQIPFFMQSDTDKLRFIEKMRDMWNFDRKEFNARDKMLVKSFKRIYDNEWQDVIESHNIMEDRYQNVKIPYEEYYETPFGLLSFMRDTLIHYNDHLIKIPENRGKYVDGMLDEEEVCDLLLQVFPGFAEVVHYYYVSLISR